MTGSLEVRERRLDSRDIQNSWYLEVMLGEEVER